MMCTVLKVMSKLIITSDSIVSHLDFINIKLYNQYIFSFKSVLNYSWKNRLRRFYGSWVALLCNFVSYTNNPLAESFNQISN